MAGISSLMVAAMMNASRTENEKKVVSNMTVKKSIETLFAESFPEFSPEIVKWFRKYKRLL